MTVPVQQNLVFVGASNHIEHDVRLHLEDNDLSVIQYNIRRLLGRLLCATY
jgi:hypothetical protein